MFHLFFKEQLESLAHVMGFDIQINRLGPRTNDAFQLYLALRKIDVSLVFDIGANVGQFSKELRSVGYKGRIVSFEPLSDAHQRLTRNAVVDSQWTVHQRIAIGEFNGNVELNIAGNSQSSSILSMLATHLDAEPTTSYIGKEKVDIARFDSIAPQYINGSENYFLKIDTQGYEWQVISGAEEVLSKAKGIYCELPLTPLYKGQRLWQDMIKRIEGKGFTLWAIQKGFIDKRDGRSLEVNAIFIRE